MIPRSRLPLSVATHALAFAGGCLLLSQFNKPPAPPSPAAPTKASQRAPAAERSVDEILGELTSPDQKLTAEKKKQQDFRDSLAAAIRDMTPPADFAAALEEAMKGWSPDEAPETPRSQKLIALMYHWLVADPAALFQWAGDDPNRLKLLRARATFAISNVLNDRGPTSLLKAIGSAGQLDNLVINLTANAIAKAGDTSAFASLRERVPPQQWVRVRELATGQWPLEKKAELLQVALEENDPFMLLAFGGKTPEAAKWIVSLENDPSLPEKFRQSLAENPSLRESLAQDPALPLADRLQYMSRLDKDAAMDQLLRNDVSKLMSDPRDWNYSFRHGQATAEEIYQSVAAATPELAAASPDALRDLVFGSLAEEDPAHAMQLLKDLPPDVQYTVLLKTTRTYFTNVEPQRFLEALQLVPADTPERWEQRLDAWNIRSFTNSNTLNEDFLTWVRELPPGLDREMGLYSLARAVQLTDLKLAAQLRTEVTDPGLQKRIAENR
ncbi:hypothetical protein [Luteolibacter soli]|uniref:Uncharacterized protein n=1 Tax=Luteolibacter soli TaxID=3135280 RepID=A0ABU9AUX6_9BACT